LSVTRQGAAEALVDAVEVAGLVEQARHDIERRIRRDGAVAEVVFDSEVRGTLRTIDRLVADVFVARHGHLPAFPSNEERELRAALDRHDDACQKLLSAATIAGRHDVMDPLRALTIDLRHFPTSLRGGR
jgi:hypothetical protein